MNCLAAYLATTSSDCEGPFGSTENVLKVNFCDCNRAITLKLRMSEDREESEETRFRPNEIIFNG